MSIVKAHATAAATHSFSMIGAEVVTIGTTTLSCVLAEETRTKDFEETGFKEILSLSAVCKTADLPTASIDKRAVTARGNDYRIEGLETGQVFTRFNLESKNKV